MPWGPCAAVPRSIVRAALVRLGRRGVAAVGAPAALRTQRALPLTAARILHSSPSDQESCEITRSALRVESETLEVTWADGRLLEFPWVWLRDNCQCPACFDPQLQSRTIDWRDVDVGVTPVSVDGDAEGGVRVRWADGHRSRFACAWLRARAFAEEPRRRRLLEDLRPRREPWDAADFPRVLRTLRYEDAMQSDACLLEWLEALATHGVALLHGAPASADPSDGPSDEPTAVRRLAERVAFIKRTHYGEEFEVRNKPDTTNVAYLSTPLQMHTDLPYYEYKPGVNLLECVWQAPRGAANLLADGLRVAEALRERSPGLHAALARTPVDWADDGADGRHVFLSLHRAPALCEDAHGTLVRINYSQQQRSSRFCVPAATALRWYKAHHAFTRLLYQPEFLVRIKTRPGDILSFDNLRVLHGREGYEDAGGRERRLVGAYLDWDIALSRMRVLRQRQAAGGARR